MPIVPSAVFVPYDRGEAVVKIKEGRGKGERKRERTGDVLLGS